MLSVTTLFPSDPPVDDEDDVDDEHAVDPRQARLQEMLRARLPRLIFTPAILAAILVVFVAMAATSGAVSFSSQTLYRWGAQFGPAIARGQWWRLLTAMWLHTNLLHIALNSLFLWRFGGYVERLLGPVVFLIVYLLAGVIASAVSLQFQASNGLSVGASGALFGLVGILLMVAMTSRGSGVLGDMLAELRPNLISVVVVNLMLGFMVQGIDNAAHIGGLAGGLALGWLVGRHSLETIPSPRVTLIPIVLTAGLATAAVVSLGWRQDILTELGRVAEHINKAEDAFRSSWADVEAGRQQAADVAADVERTVFPFIRDAQGRADEILRVATARAADAPRDSDARVAHGEAPAGVRTALTLASAWKVCLAEYAAAWQLRVAGLREHDARRVAEGDERAEAAIREMSRALAGR